MLFLREGRLFRSVSFEFHSVHVSSVFQGRMFLYLRLLFLFWAELRAAVVIYACIA